MSFEPSGDWSKEIERTMRRQMDEFFTRMAEEWLAEADRVLRQEASTRNSDGLARIADAVSGVQFENEDIVFEYEHRGAVFQEFGAPSATIEAKEAEVLAFEWPDAPREVKEQFDDVRGDMVFFKSVERSAVPAIGFLRQSRDRIKYRYEGAVAVIA